MVRTSRRQEEVAVEVGSLLSLQAAAAAAAAAAPSHSYSAEEFLLPNPTPEGQPH